MGMGVLIGVLLAAAAVPGSAAKAKRETPAKPRVLRVAKGAAFEVGPTRYIVRAVQHQKALPRPLGYEEAPPGSSFVTVTYTAENTTPQPLIEVANHFYLQDAMGRRFEISNRLQAVLAFAAIAPGNDVEVGDFMELPPGVARLLIAAFLVPDGTVESGVLVYFPTRGKFDLVEVWPKGVPPAELP